tara:strand:+ start:1009 stop:2016 length:1008 start_codon:yes stop_codon:yes gene_type:complete
MALSIDSLTAVTRDKFIPVMVDNIFKSNILTHKMLGQSEPVASGNKVLQPIEYGMNSDVSFYEGYDTLAASAQETFTDASYDWVQLRSSIIYSGREQALNSGSERVIDLISAKVKNAEKAMKDAFGKQLYSDNDGLAVTGSAPLSVKGFIGLDHLIGKTRKLGGITSTGSDYLWWDSNTTVAVKTGSTPHTYAQLAAGDIQDVIREMYGKCSIDNDKPDLIVCPQNIFDAYEESLSAQKRFGASDDSLADAGFTNLLYRGTPVVVDDHCPAGKMFFLNTKYLKFRHHADRNFSFGGFQKPVNQDAAVGHIYWLGALVCSNPRMLGKVTGLVTTYV